MRIYSNHLAALIVFLIMNLFAFSVQAAAEDLTESLVSLDYNSWFEKLTIASAAGVKQESKAQYFGIGLSMERNWLSSTWGYGVGAGLLSGRATGGDKSGSLSYFEARVPWWGGRLSPRLFYRLTPEADLGVTLSALYKQCSWPSSIPGMTAQSESDFLTGVGLELRLRVSAKFQMVQSFGVYTKDESTFWRLGVGYQF